jgi:FtsH-binding integral membrane protein
MTSPTRLSYVPPTTSRVVASTLGTLPLSMLCAAAIACFAPISQPVAIALAYVLWVPLWLAAACWIARSRSGPRAWLLTAGSTVAVAACVYAIPH